MPDQDRLALQDRIARWFGLERGTEPESAAAEPVAGPAGGSDAAGERISGPANLTQRLRTIARDRALIAAGCLHLIGLTTLKERLGPRWGRLSERIHQFAERMIERHVGPGDVWFRYGEEDYVIVFVSLDKMAAQLVCAKIVQELHTLLLGEADAHAISVYTAVAEIDGQISIEDVTLAQLLERTVAQSRTDAMQDPGSAVPAPRSGVPPQALAREAVNLLYAPVWDVRHQVITTYICRPNRRRRYGSDLWGYDVLGDSADEQAILELDLDTLLRSIEMLDDLYRNMFRMVLSLPVHFETLAVAARRRTYVEACRTIPDHLRPLVAFELMELPSGIPTGRLGELTSAVSSFSRAILAHTSIDSADLATFAAGGVRAAGVAAPAHMPEPRSIALITRFSQMAEKAGIKSFVERVASPALASAAAGAGIAYLIGPLVGGWLEVPETMARFTWKDIAERMHRSA